MVRIPIFTSETYGRGINQAMPKMGAYTQLFDEKFAENFAFVDATKIIPEEQIPIRRVGRLVLDRCVENFFAETDRLHFTLKYCPASIPVTTRCWA